MRRLIPFLIVAVGLLALAVDVLPEFPRPGADPPAFAGTRLGPGPPGAPGRPRPGGPPAPRRPAGPPRLRAHPDRDDPAGAGPAHRSDAPGALRGQRDRPRRREPRLRPAAGPADGPLPAQGGRRQGVCG